MFTFADVELGDNSAVLTQDNKKLYIRVNGSGNIVMKHGVRHQKTIMMPPTRVR